MTHGKLMHLINESDFQLLQNLKQGNNDTQNLVKKNENESDEIVMKKHLNDYLQNKNEEKFKEDKEWKKIGQKLQPIIHPDSTVEGKNTDEIIKNIVDFLPDSYQKKGRVFLERINLEDRVKFDERQMYIDGQPLQDNIQDITDHIVKPNKKIPISYNKLIDFLKEINFPKALINNAHISEKLVKILPMPDHHRASTPGLENFTTPQSSKSSKSKRKKKTKVKEDEEEYDGIGRNISFDDVRSSPYNQNGNGGFKWIRF